MKSRGSAPEKGRDVGEDLGHASVAGLLRLFGGGASGSILLALGDGPLRTKDLTFRVPGYTPRTVYRYVSRLTGIGALEREEEPGVPSKVVHSLTDPCGTDLHDVIRDYARASALLESLPDGRVVPHSWGSLTLLADLWESGMFEQLNLGPCTATQLARADHDFSFHQVTRRANLFLIGGMIRESETESRRRHYELTHEARNATAVIAGLGRWRERYAVAPGEFGLTTAEVADLVCAALPLVTLPEHEGKTLRLVVAPPDRNREGETVWAEVGAGGGVAPCSKPDAVEGWGRGKVKDWTKALLGACSKVRTGGDGSLVRDCVRGMHEALWTPRESPFYAPQLSASRAK